MKGFLQPGDYYFQGNEACVEGAIIAGCRYFSGYPITPASEISETASIRMPQVGGVFIQMEDELASVCSLIGASWAGAKALTATSGPGFSLMQEAISVAIMAETPFVIINVQRPGPGQGYITASQGDVMQARWGPHGGGSLIVLAPASVQEMMNFTIEAFNLAEKWRSPVIILADEPVAHMQEKVVVPPLEEIEVINRVTPQELGITPEDYLPFGGQEVPPMAAFGDGYKINVVSLVHHPDSNIGHYSAKLNYECVSRKVRKIEDNVDEISKLDVQFLEDSDHVIVCYGTPARPAYEAMLEARAENIRIGYVRLKTLWPFPEKKLRHLIREAAHIFMPEENLGLMIHSVIEALRDRVSQFIPIPSLGVLHSPELILRKIREVIR